LNQAKLAFVVIWATRSRTMMSAAVRIGTTFTSGLLYGDPGELVYLVIDLGLLLGVLAAYLTRSRQLGGLGFTGFAIALPCAASIVGPDGELFSVEMYQVGGAAMVLRLAMLAVAQLRYGLRRLGSTAGWLASLLAMAASAVSADVAFMVLGVTFGLGFVTVGLEVLREAKADTVNGLSRVGDQ
jgi:hypothetical protein